MLVKKPISETNELQAKQVKMENQIERFLDGFTNDVIKVLSNQSIPLK